MSFPYISVQFIINGNLNRANKYVTLIEKLMKKYPIDYQIIKTEGDEFLDGVLSLARKIGEKKNTLLVIVGGDGTLNYFVHLLEDHDFSYPIAYLPAGSGNDFARSMKLPLDLDQGLRHIFSLREARSLDILHAYDYVSGKVHIALNSLGFGLDANANYLMGQSSKMIKKSMDKHAYLYMAAKAYLRQESFSLKVKLDDGPSQIFEECKLVLAVNNESFGGGVKIYPEASNEDHLLHLLVADKVKHRDLPSILKKLFKNQSHLDHPKLKSFDFKTCCLTLLKEERGQKDGEVLEKALYDLEISVKQRLFWL